MGLEDRIKQLSPEDTEKLKKLLGVGTLPKVSKPKYQSSYVNITHLYSCLTCGGVTREIRRILVTGKHGVSDKCVNFEVHMCSLCEQNLMELSKAQIINTLLKRIRELEKVNFPSRIKPLVYVGKKDWDELEEEDKKENVQSQPQPFLIEDGYKELMQMAVLSDFNLEDNIKYD